MSDPQNSAAANVTIRLRANGPLVIDGPIKLIDSTGNAFTLDHAKAALALCRCGRSARKPFCDGSHRGYFESDERAPADQSDRSAP